MHNRRNHIALFFAVVAAACSTDGFGAQPEELAPVGSNAALVSNTLPTTLAPGEKRLVTITMMNTGAVAGTNDWPAGGSYVLKRTSTSPNPLWGIASANVPSTTPVGSNATFTFVPVAPTTPGSYLLSLQMYSTISGQVGAFGATLSTNITVDGAATAQYACAFEPTMSTVPASIAADTNATVTVAVRNMGTATWTTGPFRLYSRNSPLLLWGVGSQALGSTVAPGGVATFSLPIHSPTATGTYPFVFDMYQSPGIGMFGMDCVSTSIAVGGSPALANTLGSDTFPSVMAPGELRSVSVSFQNTGTETWTSGTTFALTNISSPNNLFGVGTVYLTSDVAPGATATFTFPITAPSSPSTYTVSLRMRKLSGTNAGFFGATFSRAVTVDSGAMASLSAAAVSNTVPTLMTAGSLRSVTITVANDGTTDWSGSAFSIRSTNSPSSLFGVSAVTLGSSETVTAGTNKVFSFTMTAPATAGMYTSTWRMFWSGGGFFGATTSAPIQVTLCGNHVVDGGEACDDGNLTNGDGCSDQCQNDPTVVVELSAGSPGRSFAGSGASPVTIGDVTDDNVADVMVTTLGPPAGVARPLNGTVYGFLGGTGFFTGAMDSVPSDATFAVVGAESRDQLGIYSTGNAIIGDVTGDGIEDLVLGAPNADGPSNSRADCGEVYVIRGGVGLASAGTIDLGAMTPSPFLATTIYGALTGDLLAPLAIGDVTGDGFNDLILGAPQYGTGGSGIGRVQILVGSASGITGTIDLAAPAPVSVFTISGTATNDRVGSLAAVGDFAGDGTTDLLLAGRSTIHLNNDGAAWGFIGPITSDRVIGMGSGGADIGWVGADANEKLGAALVVASVRGSTRPDVLIGIRSYQRSPSDFTGGIAIFEGPIAPGLYDLSVSTSSVSTMILGVDNFDEFGTPISVVDVTGDGVVDIVAAARAGDGSSNSVASAGEVYVIRGNSLPSVVDLAVPNTAAMIIYGAATGNLFASYRNTMSAGDIDGDGHADICGGSTLGSGRVDCIHVP